MKDIMLTIDVLIPITPRRRAAYKQVLMRHADEVEATYLEFINDIK